MPTVLYVGDGPEATQAAYAYFNRREKPKERWEVDVVPTGVFHRATEQGLRAWLKGEVREHPSRHSYAGLVIDWYWKDLVPAIREVHPDIPAIMLLAPDKARVDGIDHMLDFVDINGLPKKMLELIATKSA